MKTKSLIRVVTGSMVLLSLVLAFLVSPWWLALAGFVGVNLFQSAFTEFCLAELVIEKFLFRGKESPTAPDGPQATRSS